MRYEHDTHSLTPLQPAEDTEDKGSRIFKVCTMFEWPGQSEGEAMDLAHFWQVAAMHYPEDHPPEVRPDSMTTTKLLERNEYS